jgi:RimK family alpha-L-glutamate ligase
MEKRGASVVVSSLPRCAFDTRHPHGIEIPGFGDGLPDGVFVRSISAGTLEQITFRLGLLHALRESGVRVWNDARAIERCVDKSQTTFLLAKAGIATPFTRTVEGEAAARVHAKTVTAPLVIKPLFGSQGKGLGRIENESDLPAPELVDNIYYLQDFVPPISEIFEDWRVLVTRNRVVAAMTRRAGQWITNVHQGGDPVAHSPEPEMAALALSALRAVDGDYAGIDLIRAPSGQLMVLEVNSNPAWRGLQSVAELDIAQAIADDFLAAVCAKMRSSME